MKDRPRDDVAIFDAPDRNRIEMTVAGQPAGFVEYRRRPGRLVLMHTEVDDAYQGQGLAATLARAALETVRDRGLRVTPMCSYIAGYIRKHPEYTELVDDQPMS